MGDEGVGIHATQTLRGRFSLKKSEKVTRLKNGKRRNVPFCFDDCDIIDAGVPSIALLHMMGGRELVIIIDCADFGGTPGEIKVFRPEDVKRDPQKEISLHATDLLTTLDVGTSIGLKLPTIWIIGIQPAKIEQTMQLSDQANAALEKIADTIKNVIVS